MRTSSLLFVAVCAFLGTGSLMDAVSDEAAKQPDRPVLGDALPKLEGMKCVCELQPQGYNVLGPCLVRVRLTNGRSDEVRMLRYGLFGHLFLTVDEVRGDAIAPAPLTVYGERLWTRPPRGSAKTEYIAPGESFAEVVHLSRLFDLSKVGTYRVRAQFVHRGPVQDRAYGTISEPATFTVGEVPGIGRLDAYWHEETPDKAR